MNRESLVETLLGIRFLQGISRKHLEQIAAFAQVHEYGESDVVFHEGDVADSACFVISGKLSLELSPSTMYHKCLVSVGPGEMLGWSSLIEHSHFAATAVVVEPAKLVLIDGLCLRKMCQRRFPVRLRFHAASHVCPGHATHGNVDAIGAPLHISQFAVVRL